MARDPEPDRAPSVVPGLRGRGSFQLERLGQARLEPSSWKELSACLIGMEEERCLPEGRDGVPMGNAALKLDHGILVTRSCRRAGGREPSDYVKTVFFDAERWSTTFFSQDPQAEPSSDTPLHWAALIQVPETLGWTERPAVCLHGHALASEEAADRLGIPISPLLTAYGSREDYLATWELLRHHPYPAHRLLIRKGHGFLALGPTGSAALAVVREAILRARSFGIS